MANRGVARAKANFNWLLWWKTDAAELHRQAAEYRTLKITQSARGISLLLMLFSAAVTSLLAYFAVVDRIAYVDAAISVILGVLIYRGMRWAMLFAMLYWTFEKIYLVVDPPLATITVNPVLLIVAWCVYMHAFWLAYRVEQARRNASPSSGISAAA